MFCAASLTSDRKPLQQMVESVAKDPPAHAARHAPSHNAATNPSIVDPLIVKSLNRQSDNGIDNPPIPQSQNSHSIGQSSIGNVKAHDNRPMIARTDLPLDDDGARARGDRR